MNKKYKVVVAFLLTILLVLGSGSMALAEQPDKDSGGTSIHLKDNSGEGIKSVVVYFGTTPITLEKDKGNNWEASDAGSWVLGQITKIVVDFEEYDINEYQYPTHFGPQGGKLVEPIEYSNEGVGTGSINLWLNYVLNARPSIQLEKTVNPEYVNDKSDEVEYSFTVTNNGNVDLVYVVLSDVQLGLNIKIGDLDKGKSFTTDYSFDLGDLSESDWSGNTFTNTAKAVGTYWETEVSATDSAIVTYTTDDITPGAIRILKDVPNVANSNVEFEFTVLDGREHLVTTGTATEVDPLIVSDLEPGRYLVEEKYNSDYETDELYHIVSVVSGKTTDVTFVNTLIENESTPGAIEIIKDVPNVTNSSVYFNFYVYQYGEVLVASGSAAEIDSLLINDLEPGEYTVSEEPMSGYDTADSVQDVTVVAGETTPVTFVNTLINNPDTSEAAIQVIKTVDPSSVNSRTATVTYTFKVENVGDYDLHRVTLRDAAIGLVILIGDLPYGSDPYTTSVAFSLANLGTEEYGDWNGNDGDSFTNTAYVIGYYGDEQQSYVTDDDDATVTYSADTPNNPRHPRTPTTTTVTPEPTPAGPVVETPLIEEPIPAAPLPQTGGIPALLFFGAGGLLAGAGTLLRRKQK